MNLDRSAFSARAPTLSSLRIGGSEADLIEHPLEDRVQPPRPISSVAALISSARSAISSIAASSKSRVTAFGWGQRFFA